jgi:antitoxin (DNA-binding transcriptional repressor) of toxin-antitoxin stability system
MSELVKRVAATDLIHSTKAVMDFVTKGGESVEITYHGVPRALISPIVPTASAAGNPVERAIRDGLATVPEYLPLPRRAEPLRGRSGLTVDALLAEVRADKA